MATSEFRGTGSGGGNSFAVEDLLSLIALTEDPLTSAGVPTIVGIEPVGDEIKLNVREIPYDQRSGTAGLFGFRAPPSWIAVGVAFGGNATSMDPGDPKSTSAACVVVLKRSGEMASCLALDGEAATSIVTDGSPQFDDERPGGNVVDTLHRILDLPCPGPPPPLSQIVMSLWSEEIAELALDSDGITWAAVAALHPAIRASGAIPPSVEMLAEATIRAAATMNWDRLHHRSCRGSVVTAQLTAREVRWMDVTMFARWTSSLLLDPWSLTEILTSLGSDEAAEGLRSVVDAVHRREQQMNNLGNLPKSA